MALNEPQPATEASKKAPERPRGSPWGRRGLIAAAAILIAVITYRILTTHRTHRFAQAPQAVGVARVGTGNMPEIIRALGTVTPIATVTVVPQLSGYLTAVGFREGEDVKKGQFLAQIDPRPYELQLQQYRAALARDQASLNMARSDLARYQRLQAQKSIAEQTVSDQRYVVEQDQAVVKVDEANIASANLDLAYCHITAPITGRVGLRLIDPGNYVTAGSGTGIVVITALKPISVIFAIPQNQLTDVFDRFKTGARLMVKAYNSTDSALIATGTVTALDNQMNTTTGTVQLRAVFANDNDALFPNEFVNVVLQVNTIRGATLVPTQAVQTGAPGDYVYVVNPNHTVSLRVVKIGIGNGIDTVVKSGLKPGETVVTDGVDRLTNGARVTVVSPATRKNPKPGFGSRTTATETAHPR